MTNKRSLIFHDAFTTRSGAERMNISMANILNADIATAIWSTNCYDPGDLGYHGKIFEIFKKFHGGWIGFFRMKWGFFWSRHITKNYDRIIFTNEALTGIHRVKPGTETIYYAHSLPHELFDERKLYMSNVPFFFHEFYALALLIRKLLYLYEIRKVGKIFTNSEMNKNWLSQWSKRDDIIVLYPPVNTLRFRATKQKESFIVQEHNNVESVIEKEVRDYYVSFSRLESQKRIDRIVHAFMHMPEKNIIIIYNSHDSEKQSVMHMARGYNNIFFHREPSDLKLTKIIGSAVASIALSKNENFGSVAIESMACGIPVIAVDEGGYKETVIHGKTGILVPADFTVYNTMDAVKSLTPERSLLMKNDCLARAKEFSLENFSRKFMMHLDL